MSILNNLPKEHLELLTESAERESISVSDHADNIIRCHDVSAAASASGRSESDQAVFILKCHAENEYARQQTEAAG